MEFCNVGEDEYGNPKRHYVEFVVNEGQQDVLDAQQSVVGEPLKL